MNYQLSYRSTLLINQNSNLLQNLTKIPNFYNRLNSYIKMIKLHEELHYIFSRLVLDFISVQFYIFSAIIRFSFNEYTSVEQKKSKFESL